MIPVKVNCNYTRGRVACEAQTHFRSSLLREATTGNASALRRIGGGGVGEGGVSKEICGTVRLKAIINYSRMWTVTVM